ncbi:MAG TPA: hypothetical protein VFZ07_10240, partial [Dongiaceae bacterium]
MGEYVTRDKTGVPFLFEISGDTPSPTEMARIDEYLKNGPKPVVAAETPKPEEEPGIGANLAANVARGWNETQAGIDIGMQGLHEYLGNKGKARQWGEAAAEQLAERDEYKVREKSFTEEEGVYGKAASLTGTLARTAAPAVLSAAAAIGGAAIGGPVGFAAGLLAGTAAYAPQMLSSNAERQIEQHGSV